MYSVYILRDDKNNLYKGMTSNLESRLKRHRHKHTKTTAKMENLSVAYVGEFDTFDDARKRELYFKSAAGRRFLKKKLGP